jgi:tRNA(adenine34) deaminase
MDEFYMNEALKEAAIAYGRGEVPIGSVLVLDGKIIARSFNQVEFLQDATAHAEMLCIKMGAHILKNWRLNETTLYSTLEPCIMCAGSLILSRVGTLVWGAPDLRHGADGSLFDILTQPHPIHRLTIRRGVLKERCASLIQNFFKERRMQKKIILDASLPFIGLNSK